MLLDSETHLVFHLEWTALIEATRTNEISTTTDLEAAEATTTFLAAVTLLHGGEAEMTESVTTEETLIATTVTGGAIRAVTVEVEAVNAAAADLSGKRERGLEAGVLHIAIAVICRRARAGSTNMPEARLVGAEATVTNAAPVEVAATQIGGREERALGSL
jgi:hypothetical protein